MEGQPTEGAPARGNVIDLRAYRRSRHSVAPMIIETPIAFHAKVYVDLDSAGRLAYGLAHADSANALSLLEPTLYLAGQLLKIAIEEEH